MDLQRYYQEFSDALIHAFDDGQMTMMLKFKMNVAINNIVGPGPFGRRVFDLVAWCDGEGRVDELFASALEAKPLNPRLRTLAAKMANDLYSIHDNLATEVKQIDNRALDNSKAEEMRQILTGFQANGSLQALIVSATHLNSGQDVVAWSSRLQQSYRCICSIGRNGKHAGTGFLVGPDRIMTNSHVVVSEELAAYDVVFDYVKGKTRSSITPTYKLKTELFRSQPREYDNVILRLDPTPEGNRDYFRAKPYQFEKIREPVSVLGHPNGDPMNIAFGVVYDANSFFGRVAYTANTAPGSSGSPVFGENWDLVALHHHGETNVNNHGIPMKVIVEHLKSTGHSDLLEST